MKTYGRGKHCIQNKQEIEMYMCSCTFVLNFRVVTVLFNLLYVGDISS